MVMRWKFEAQAESYTVPINPDAMGSLFGARNITSRATLRGPVLLFEANKPPAAWSFSGTILDSEHYENLRHWVYDIRQRVTITDHFGRTIVCVLLEFKPEPKRSGSHFYWRHTYSIDATVISVSAPTIL